MKLRVMFLVAALFAVGAVSLLAQAGSGTGPRGARMYDPKTETTVKGTVEEVQTISGQGMMGTGIHLMLKTESGLMEVHVGPSRYVAKQNFTLAKGDAIEVTGSKVKMNGKDVLVAREIKKGDSVLALRNAQGIPNWSRGGSR